MCRSIVAWAALLMMCTATNAGVFRFDTDPFFGTNALTTPGRQVVGGEGFISFDPAADVFSLESSVFGMGTSPMFFNGLAGAIPNSGANTVVLQSFDNDSNSATPFAAGNAADLIAAQVTTPGPGFFVYFNQGLDLPRLVFSRDLSDNTADLKVLFRMTNLAGQPGRDAMPTFTVANFELTAVPEPSSVFLTLIAGTLLGVFTCNRRRTSARS